MLTKKKAYILHFHLTNGSVVKTRPLKKYSIEHSSDGRVLRADVEYVEEAKRGTKHAPLEFIRLSEIIAVEIEII